ncbi:hypothetical protein MCAP1_001443 [Malassezia caprae]|uniref:Histone deacetylase complex subunit SAP30 Sin3 binding domain-containing protein n=1 Tax=Malassezia caprae TaxID=1381934 RepID=A0AAF0E6U7_9BASI|nr:hypothetical protein MCAP1_001443 [Malassezia caprae]
MSQVAGDASAREKQATEGSSSYSINFSDLPFDATIKYLAQHQIEPQYPPRTMLQDPRIDAPPEAPSQEETSGETQEPMNDDQGVASRTRSSTTQSDRARDGDVHYFDRDDEHEHLAALANEHFHSVPMPKETDIIVGFLHRCRRADAVLKI